MRHRSLAVMVLCIGATACSPYLHSPPGRMVPLEAAKALPKGDFAIQGAFAGGGAFWGPSVGAGTLQGRYGFGHGFQGDLEAGFAVMGARDTDWNTSASHALYSARAGFKYEAASWFAVQAGLGGGGSAGGGYISPDAGIIFSYQGKNVVPFVSGSFYSSHPINAKPIVFQDQDSTEVLLPDRTLGAYGNFGLRIPITGASADSPRTAIMFAYRFVVASHHEYIGSSEERWNDLYQLGVLGFDLVMRKHGAKGGSDRGGWKMH
jgi:hypothetical protein